MSLSGFDLVVGEPGLLAHWIRFQGAGAATPSDVYSAGAAITYVSTGRYRITWGEAQGAFAGHLHGLQATTPADVDGWTVVLGAYDTTNKRVDVYVYNDTPTLADLAANCWINLAVMFKQTGVSV